MGKLRLLLLTPEELSVVESENEKDVLIPVSILSVFEHELYPWSCLIHLAFIENCEPKEYKFLQVGLRVTFSKKFI